MKFFVLSDTHGRLGPAEAIANSISDLDAIIHLGDYQRDGELLKKTLGIPVISLKGNMDGSFGTEDYIVLETEFGKLYLSHGHIESVKYGYEKLLYKAASLDCKAALFGHTHAAFFEMVDGMYLLNPGSLTNPRGARVGSYALLTTEKDAFSANIIYLEPAMQTQTSNTSNQTKAAVSTGFLRSRFNDSDGQ